MRIIAKGLFNLIVRRYMGPFWYRRQWLNKTQWLSKEELSDIQFNLLKQTIRYAERHVPYYQQLMKNRGFSSEDIRSLEDIELFPVLTKRDVINAGDTMLSQTLPKWMLRRARTSGTTGAPVTLYRSLFSIGTEHAFMRRQWDWAGIGFNDKCAFLKGRVITKPQENRNAIYLYDPVMKELHLSTYHLSTETARDYAEIIRSYQVKAIVGYPSSVCILAHTCKDYGIELNVPSVLLTSEILTESIREVIASAFKCKIYDFYGAAERVCYIHTCEKGSCHVIPEYGVTELLPDKHAGSGQCRIVSTSFWNNAMPLIRYDTGDQAVLSEEICSCGRSFPVISKIFGREGDFIITPSGRKLGASIVTHLVYVVCGGGDFIESQVIQDADNHITIEYVPGKSFSVQQIRELGKNLSKHLGYEVSVDFRQVQAVQRTEAGKIRAIISLLS